MGCLSASLVGGKDAQELHLECVGLLPVRSRGLAVFDWEKDLGYDAAFDKAELLVSHILDTTVRVSSSLPSAHGLLSLPTQHAAHCALHSLRLHLWQCQANNRPAHSPDHHCAMLSTHSLSKRHICTQSLHSPWPLPSPRFTSCFLSLSPG